MPYFRLTLSAALLLWTPLVFAIPDDLLDAAFKAQLLKLPEVQRLTTTAEDISIKEADVILGCNSSGFYDVTLKGVPYFAKRLNEKRLAKSGDSEQIKLQMLESFLDSYEKDDTPGLPKIVRYFGDVSFSTGAGDYSILLFEQAKGIDLGNFMCETILKEFEDKWEERLAGFRTVGESIAKFHLKHRSPDESDFKTIIHGDLHMDNIFFDPSSGQVTFVDVESMEIAPKSTRLEAQVLCDFKDAFNYLTARANQLYKDWLPKSSSDNQGQISLQPYWERYQRCAEALIDGYNDSLERAGLSQYKFNLPW